MKHWALGLGAVAPGRRTFVVLAGGEPVEVPARVVPLLHNFELGPKHLVVGLLLRGELLEVGEHHCEFGLHFGTELVGATR